MAYKTILRLGAAVAVLAGGVLVSAQQSVQLPSSPAKGFGGSITPAYEGWFDNPDGTHSFLIGYYSRNTQSEVDIPLGPNNHFEPTADVGQPTHFLTRRRYGMFVVTVPKEFTKTQKISWTLTTNGVTTTVPFHMHVDYNITPLKSSEESPNREFNTPPILRFTETGPKIAGPMATTAKAIDRTATVGTPMVLDFWTDDDALYSTGGNGPLAGDRPPVNISVTKHRGPGTVTVENPKLAALKGGKPLEAYSGKGAASVKFSEAGEYLLHVQANDYSGQGGGGSGCCWTTQLVKVVVRDSGNSTRGNQ